VDVELDVTVTTYVVSVAGYQVDGEFTIVAFHGQIGDWQRGP